VLGGETGVGDAEVVQVGDRGGQGDDEPGDPLGAGGAVALDVGQRAGADEGTTFRSSVVVARRCGTGMAQTIP
jgi:hypothetical protein